MNRSRLTPIPRDPRSSCRRALAASLAVALLGVAFATQAAEAVNYRGTLLDAGKPAEGIFDMQLRFHDADTEGNALSEPVWLSAVEVRNGRFEIPLDLPPGASLQPQVWVEALIRTEDGAMHHLQGRQQVKGGEAMCWDVTGNDTNAGTLGLNDSQADDLLSIRSGDQYVYLRGAGGFEQQFSSALGPQSAAFNVSSARGENSFTAGKGETVNTHSYSFAFADGQAGTFSTSAADQFAIRARNGVGINAAPPDLNVELTVTATEGAGNLPDIWLRPNPAVTSNTAGIMLTAGDATSLGPIPFNNAGFYIDNRSASGNNFFRRMALEPGGAVIIRSSTSDANVGVTVAAGSGSWSSLSDRSMKTAIVPADVVSILDRVVSMPMSTWSYIAQGEGVRHIGPMAQDFAASFGFGENNTTISNIDADGVALAAIQGLNAKLEAENAELHQRLAAIEATLQVLQPADAH